MRLIALLTLLISFSVISSDETVAVVDLTFITDTEIESGKMCFDEKHCQTWSTFILYKAELKNLISGLKTGQYFKIIYGRHSYNENAIENVKVYLKKLEPNNKFGAKYQVIRLE